MGPPPSGGGGPAQAINGSLRKPVRAGRAIILTAWVTDCAKWLPTLQLTRERAVGEGLPRVVLRTHGVGPEDGGVTEEQRLAFQYLATEVRRSTASANVV